MSSEFFEDRRTFSPFEAYLHLYAIAKEGEVTSCRSLMTRWGWHHGTSVRRFLDKVRDKGYLDIEGDRDGLHITIPSKAKVVSIDPKEEERAFAAMLTPYVDQYGKDMIRRFYDYWRERKGTGRMRWQKETTFDIKLRLIRWHENNNKFARATQDREAKALDDLKKMIK